MGTVPMFANASVGKMAPLPQSVLFSEMPVRAASATALLALQSAQIEKLPEELLIRPKWFARR